MERFSITHALVGGVTVYAAMFFMWSLFISYGFTEGIAPRLVGLIALVFLLVHLTHQGKAVGIRAIPYALSWLLITFLFDVLSSVPFFGWSMFSDPNLWVGYGLIFVVPLFVGFQETFIHKTHPGNTQ